MSEKYREYLKSPAWQDKRLMVRRRAEDWCEMCQLRRGSDVHHIQYPLRLGQEIPCDLILLCKHCHTLAHKPWSLDKVWDGVTLGPDSLAERGGWWVTESRNYEVPEMADMRHIVIQMDNGWGPEMLAPTLSEDGRWLIWPVPRLSDDEMAELWARWADCLHWEGNRVHITLQDPRSLRYTGGSRWVHEHAELPESVHDLLVQDSRSLRYIDEFREYGLV